MSLQNQAFLGLPDVPHFNSAVVSAREDLRLVFAEFDHAYAGFMLSYD